jgi:hypothetical protein
MVFDCRVTVYKDMTEIYDLSRMGKLIRELRVELCGLIQRFADDHELAFDRRTQQGVALIFVEIPAARKLVKKVGSLTDIKEMFANITLHKAECGFARPSRENKGFE